MDAVGRKDTDEWVPLSAWNWADYQHPESDPFGDIGQAKAAWCRRFGGLAAPYRQVQRGSIPAPTHLRLAKTTALHLAGQQVFRDIVKYMDKDLLLPCGLPPVLRGLIVEII